MVVALGRKGKLLVNDADSPVAVADLINALRDWDIGFGFSYCSSVISQNPVRFVQWRLPPAGVPRCVDCESEFRPLQTPSKGSLSSG